MLRVLMICTGNTCRSPMAQALLDKVIRDRGWTDRISVASAGLHTGNGLPASAGALAAMKNRGLDLSPHSSRQALPETVQAADLVLVMTEAHKQRIAALAGERGDRVYTLAEYAGEERDVSDPFGCGPTVYEVCAAELERLINKAWQKIMDLAGKKGLA